MIGVEAKTVVQSWKPIFIVLRPDLLSIYRDKKETKLRHQINLSDLSAVARQKDPKRKGKHVFALFSPSRNYHLEAKSEQEAQEWMELIRREARIDRDEEEMYLASPSGTQAQYHGFERSIDAQISPLHDERGGYSSSDAEVLNNITHTAPKARSRGSTYNSARRPSQVDYSGAEHGSYSDFSDSGLTAAARMSALSLPYTDGRPSTSSNYPSQHTQANAIYGGGQSPARPSMSARNPSQLSNLGGLNSSTQNKPTDSERVVYHGWIYLLKSKSGVRSWKKIWMVLRPKALAMYKNEEEYTALLIIPFHTIIDVVEIDAISRSKTSCMQIISDERNYRFCAMDEESLARWLGAFKSLLSKRKASAMQQIFPQAAVAVQPPTPPMGVAS
jgi:hypothetical protein